MGGLDTAESDRMSTIVSCLATASIALRGDSRSSRKTNSVLRIEKRDGRRSLHPPCRRANGQAWDEIVKLHTRLYRNAKSSAELSSCLFQRRGDGRLGESQVGASASKCLFPVTPSIVPSHHLARTKRRSP